MLLSCWTNVCHARRALIAASILSILIGDSKQFPKMEVWRSPLGRKKGMRPVTHNRSPENLQKRNSRRFQKISAVLRDLFSRLFYASETVRKHLQRRRLFGQVSFGFIRAEDVLMKKQTWNSHRFSFHVSVCRPKEER